VGGYDAAETSSNSIDEDEDPDIEDQEWGLHKGMELYEVSAKDDFGDALSIPMVDPFTQSFTYRYRCPLRIFDSRNH
jgi:hypothetical protein